jgi:hypothetical protein
MKKLSIKILVTFYLTLFTTCFVLAQEKIDYDAEGGLIQFNIFHFEGTEKNDITFSVPKQLKNLNIEIKSYISIGELSIKIFDPTGEEQGNFSVQGQLNSNKSLKKNEIRRSTELITTKMRIEKDPWIFTKGTFKVMGMGDNVAQASIYRSFKNPMEGNWAIKIICKNAKGLFTIENNHKLLNPILGNLPAKSVTGSVYDTKNRPLAGATVLIKGTSLGTVTDNNGNFSIPIRDNSEKLLFHYKGMISQEVEPGDQVKITVILNKK